MIQLINYLGDLVIQIISGMGYWGVAICMAIESCNIPLPSEIIQPFGGYLVSTGRFTFVNVVMAGTLGGMLGSMISYYLGSIATHTRALFWISDTKVKTLTAWFKRHGENAVFFGRLLPGIRTFISLPAGIARMNLTRFIIYTFFGSLIWSIFLTYLGYILGQNWRILSRYFHDLDLLVLLAVLGLVIYYYWHRRIQKW